MNDFFEKKLSMSQNKVYEWYWHLSEIKCIKISSGMEPDCAVLKRNGEIFFAKTRGSKS